MTNRMKKLAVLGGAAAVLAIGAGVAVAGGALDDDREAFLNDVAKRLDVTPTELEKAIQGAYNARIDAAVKAGKITKEQGEAMKKRAAEGGLPLLPGGHHGGFGPGFGPGPGFGHHGHIGVHVSLEAAAKYLGLTEAELRTQLRSGKTLAEVAKAEGKSLDGLEKALTAEAKKKLDAAVKAGKLTQAQADELLKRATEHLDDVVNGTAGPRGFGGRHGFWKGGPPPGSQPAVFAPAGMPA